ncbi:hypothetical protein FRC09_013776 [Ceratobasidium sp. 395]|nr:hypothetical protein FRC09_013776 [Ceratobasidium sp. 395]
MENPVWESPDCGIDTPRNVTCEQGFVPTYAVVAKDAQDVRKSVVFAGKYRLRLVVKNTGHDYLGRSSAEGSFSIWTHQLKGINFYDSFVSKGCPNKIPGVPAVTLGAAEQWRDVYDAVDKHNMTIVGGAANSVGAAGGWVQGGGHSPLGWLYGMGVDNVLQYTIVKPNGKIVAANSCQNQDLFWALRGGGGGTWGVALDVTYKTHPALDSIVGLSVSMNFTSPEKLTSMAETFLHAFPNVSDQNIRGWAVWTPPATLSLVIFHPNSPSVKHTNQTLAPVWEWIANNTETQVTSSGSIHPTFLDFFKVWIASDAQIAVPLWIGGKLVSRKAMQTRPSELAKLISNALAYTPSLNFVGGGAVSKVDPESAGLNPQWRNDALISWNMGSTWNDTTPAETIDNIKKTITDYTQALGELAGLDQAAYFNEADPQEPVWKKAFFGAHYNRLLRIKRDVDPEGLFTCNRCVGSDL